MNARNHEQLGIDQLSAQDRFALMREIWDSLAADLEGAPLTEDLKHEIDRRLAAHRDNPPSAIPWDHVEAEALGRLRR